MKNGIWIFVLCLLVSAGILWAHEYRLLTRVFEFHTGPVEQMETAVIEVHLSPHNEVSVRFNGRFLGSRSNFCEALGGDDG